MRLDPKYFNVFLLIVAVVAAILMAFFILNNRSTEKTAFKEQMFANDSLQTVYWRNVEGNDSLRVRDFKGNFVILNFWANWSDASLESQQKLAQLKSKHADTLEVIAAAVGLTQQEATEYIADHNFPFHFVAGSRQFSDFSVPGLPAQLIYNPNGTLQRIFLGYQNESQYDSLRVLIDNGTK
jgi:thiol-disulfide isomerase/thioredoxin